MNKKNQVNNIRTDFFVVKLNAKLNHTQKENFKFAMRNITFLGIWMLMYVWLAHHLSKSQMGNQN